MATKNEREPIAWVTRGGKHIPIFEEGPSAEESKKDKQIADNKSEADKKNADDDKFKRDKWFDATVYAKLPKKMQVKNIVSIGKHKDSDGVRYNASVVWEDGFNRSVSEYGWTDFKAYLETVLTKDRKYQQ